MRDAFLSKPAWRASPKRAASCWTRSAKSPQPRLATVSSTQSAGCLSSRPTCWIRRTTIRRTWKRGARAFTTTGYGPTNRYPCFPTPVLQITRGSGAHPTSSPGNGPTTITSGGSTASAIFRSSGRNPWSNSSRSAPAMPDLKRLLLTGDTVGGVWTYTLDLARGLAPHGIETVLAAMGGEPAPEQRAEAQSIPNLRLFSSGYKLEWMEDPWRDVEESGRWLLGL